MFVLAAATEGGHSVGLLQDLGVIITAAAVASILFYRLKLPVIFGYLLVGLLLGPNLLPGSPITSLDSIQQLSELGVIFLLFFIGLEFDLRRLQAVAIPALLALVFQVLLMLFLAQLAAPFLGWNPVSTLFFGSILAISSSMVTVKVLRDLGQMQEPHAQLTIGILILEDVLAVILLVILTGVAATKQFAWDTAWLVVFLMGLFVVATFVIGRVIAPRVLDRLAADQEAGEQVTLFSLGLVMGISILALMLNFSPALGAFLAGAILSQTRMADRVETTTRSLYELFAAIFFVTIGMLMDPFLIWENLGWVLGLSALVLLGKHVSCWLGLFLAGESPRHGFRAAAAKAQIGEFSFIIAGLGTALGVTTPQLSAIAFGVAFFTILITPGFTAKSESIFDWVNAHTPKPICQFGGFYRRFFETVGTAFSSNAIFRLLRQPLGRMLLYFGLLNAILVGGFFTAQSVQREVFYIADIPLGPWLVWIFAAALAAPCLIAIVHYLNLTAFTLADALFATGTSRPIGQGRMRTVFNGLAHFVVFGLFALLFLIVSGPFLPGSVALALGVVSLIFFAAVFWRQLVSFNIQVESMFLETFSAVAQDAAAARRAAVVAAMETEEPWPFEIGEALVADGAEVAGKRIRDLGLRQATGAHVVAIARGRYEVFDPNADTPLFPGDTLVLLGSPEQLAAAKKYLEKRGDTEISTEREPFATRPVLLPVGHPLDGNTLAGGNVRREFGISVIAFQRGSERTLTPAPDEMLRAGDVLLTVGRPDRLDAFAALSEPIESGV